MSSGGRISSDSLAVLGAFLAVGLVVAGGVLGSEIKSARLGDRYVTVKGLVERRVKSDLAIWPVTLQETGDDLQAVTTRAQTDQQAITVFFTAQGFSAADVAAGVIQVIDTQADRNGGTAPPHRFLVKQTLTLTTANVDAATAASQHTLTLLKAGIVLVAGNPYGQPTGVSYLFNGLNAIKPDMITEATRNARTAADRFAADSGSKVGSIRQAEQGVFSITAANGDSAAGPEGAFGSSDTGSLMKKVRVVTTVQYYLEQ